MVRIYSVHKQWSLAYLYKIKHIPRINILIVLKYKTNKELFEISSIFSWKWWINIIKIYYLF